MGIRVTRFQEIIVTGSDWFYPTKSKSVQTRRGPVRFSSSRAFCFWAAGAASAEVAGKVVAGRRDALNARKRKCVCSTRVSARLKPCPYSFLKKTAARPVLYAGAGCPALCNSYELLRASPVPVTPHGNSGDSVKFSSLKISF